MSRDLHTRIVAWLKLALPLIAIGLLSTLFLLSRSVNPTAVVPFEDNEVRQRWQNRQVTGPYFSSTTSDGDEIDFIARTVTTPDGLTGANYAEDILVQIDTASGSEITVSSDRALFDLAADQSELIGNVVVTTSSGYTIQSQKIVSRVSQLDLSSPAKVHANGPVGELTAGSMHIFTLQQDDSLQLLFTSGVKLVYDPKQAKD